MTKSINVDVSPRRTLGRYAYVAAGRRVLGEGQFMAEGVLPRVGTVGSKGFLSARIELDGPEFARELPLRAARVLPSALATVKLTCAQW